MDAFELVHDAGLAQFVEHAAPADRWELAVVADQHQPPVLLFGEGDEVGEGRMTIERSTADRAIEIRLEFLKPFATTNQTVFSFTTAGTGTKVNWAMTGQNNFFGKAFTLFMDMDKMVGDDFDKGLTKLKELSEKGTP